jgi:hypothetical protein
MSAVQQICVSCGKLFTPRNAENTICLTGKHMISEFYECDECIGKAEYELPTNENAVASAPHTPTAWTRNPV